MRKFYFEDKEKRSAYLGIMPSNEVNLLPFQHYRCGLAESFYMILSQLKSDSERIPENVMRQTALGQTDRYISKLLLKAKRKPEIQKLLVDDSLSYKEQNKLLNGLTLMEKTRARDPLHRLRLTLLYENTLTPLNEIKLTPTEKTLQGIFL